MDSMEHPLLDWGAAWAHIWAAGQWWRQKVEIARVPAQGPVVGHRFSDMDKLAPGLEPGLLVLVHFSSSCPTPDFRIRVSQSLLSSQVASPLS